MIDHIDSIIPHLDDYRYKSGMKDLQVQFYKKYSEHYCDRLDWLKMEWGYISLFIQYIMGTSSDIPILHVIMGKLYLRDLMEFYGPFLD